MDNEIFSPDKHGPFFFFFGGGGQDSWELSSVLILELNSVRYLRLEKLSGGGRETSDVITEAW